ncbi:MAG: carboxypeptidase regulatory-like domain-containing protein [Acidobacteriaceae bacterium]|nr:carboxypeptidase regulatory-like domain-containing protein [Acidobacteriaceae bacterium]MBV9501125.1 carboxypeptidase regulatory-like domain-containing protein [Acidobacteriaceae bacterium]
MARFRAGRQILWAALLFSSAVTSVWGQVVGAAISGTVRDETGAPIVEASVTVHSLETGAERQLLTDGEGHYSAISIEVGRYELKATKAGFAPQTKTGIVLEVGQKATVDLTLRVGDLRQEVVVTDTPPPVSLATQDTSGLVNERQVKDLPLNGRSYDQLVTLNPSIVNYSSQRSGGIGTSNSSVGNMFAISGHRPQENLFLLNGIEYTGASTINVTPGGASGQLLGVDAVREFNVVADTYGAEYGKRPGGQISIITASGTNDLHGSVYEFLRNNALDARNFFDQGGAPQFQRNDFGGALGGPIKKNKVFVFGNYEGFRQHLGLSNVTLVPDNNARTGYVPDASGALQKVKVSPASAALLDLWPVQNGPELGGAVAVAFNHPLQTIREDFGTTRLDYNVSTKDTLFAVWTVDDSADNTPSVNPLSGVEETLREQVASIQEQHIFSPTVLNTARFGFSRAGYFFTGYTPVDLPGWVEGDPIGAVVIGGGTALNGASQISLAGTNAGSNLTAVRNLFTYDDHVAITRGIHQIEAGVWFQRIQANDDLAQYQYGQASFGSLASFLKGAVSTFTVIPSPTPLGWRSLESAGFVQDAIRVTNRLEVRLGFRFESTNGWNEAHGRASNYVFDSSGIIQTNPRIADSAFTVNRAKFLPEPRVAVAWDPSGKSKTVIRAGFGIYRALLDNLDYRLDQAGPFNTTQSLKNASLASIHIVPGEELSSSALISPSGVQPDAYTPTVLSYTFKVEQQIAPSTSLSLGYTGSHGYHEMLSVDANEPFPTVCPAAPCPASLATGTIYYPPNAKFANPALANTTTWFSEGVSSYNALSVDVNRRFSNGFQLRGVYTFSKSLDDGTAWNSSVAANAPGFVMFPLDPKLDWGPSTTDVRNLAVINGTYELPFGTGKMFLKGVSGWRRALVDGWSISGIGTLQSGLPFTAQLGFNPTNNGDSRNPIRPSVNPAFTGKVITGNPNQYFNPNAFVLPANGTYGNVGRDTLSGPGIAELDVSALKATRISERINLQFRAEFFNVLNHANFGVPNAVVFTSTSPTPASTAGVITSTSTTSRQIQLGLKLLF